jgi:hypothetical protein
MIDRLLRNFGIDCSLLHFKNWPALAQLEQRLLSIYGSEGEKPNLRVLVVKPVLEKDADARAPLLCKVLEAFVRRQPVISFHWVKDSLVANQGEVADLSQYLLSDPRKRFSSLFKNYMFDFSEFEDYKLPYKIQRHKEFRRNELESLVLQSGGLLLHEVAEDSMAANGRKLVKISSSTSDPASSERN